METTRLARQGPAGEARRRTALLGVERQARRRKVGYVEEGRGRHGTDCNDEAGHGGAGAADEVDSVIVCE